MDISEYTPEHMSLHVQVAANNGFSFFEINTRHLTWASPRKS